MQQTYITLNDGNKIPQFGMGVHGDKNLINEPVFTELGKKYDKTNVQIILHWNIQEGNIIFPKSTNPQHIRDNFDSFDFELTADDEVGVIEKGNTEIIAEMITEKMGAEIFQIQPTTPYSETYDELLNAARQESADNSPEIADTV